MKIAILGWGSLLWDKRTLEIDENEGGNQYQGWFDNGPSLPIEFARISNDNRITLVIKEGSRTVITFYAISKHNDLDSAISNLARREKTNPNNIGYYLLEGSNVYPSDFKFVNVLKAFINASRLRQQNIDCVIWTNLPPKPTNITIDHIFIHIKELQKENLTIVAEYIDKTPSQINTTNRTAIEKMITELKKV